MLQSGALPRSGRSAARDGWLVAIGDWLDVARCSEQGQPPHLYGGRTVAKKKAAKKGGAKKGGKKKKKK
jgi:hypothetical protein